MLKMCEEAMAKDRILAKLARIIISVLETPREMIVPEASFINDLKADSLNFVDIIMSTEEHFKVDIPLDVEIKTIKDLVEAVVAAKTTTTAAEPPNALEAMARQFVGPSF